MRKFQGEKKINGFFCISDDPCEDTLDFDHLNIWVGDKVGYLRPREVKELQDYLSTWLQHLD